MSRRPTATILKLIKGDTHTARHRDDAPKVPGLPRIPPGTVLTPDECAMWEYLMEHVVVAGVHGTGDGAAFVNIARAWVLLNVATAKLAEHGPVMKSPKGKPEPSPYTRISRDLRAELRLALGDVGATPTGRWKTSGPRGSGPGAPATSWDEID